MSLSVASPTQPPVHPVELHKSAPRPTAQPNPAQPQIPADRVTISPAALSSTSPASGGDPGTR